MPQEFNSVLYAGMGLCVLMIVFNLARVKKRGVSAYFLAGAFAAFAGILFALLQGNDTAIYVLAPILCLLLVADGALRSAKLQKKESP